MFCLLCLWSLETTNTFSSFKSKALRPSPQILHNSDNLNSIKQFYCFNIGVLGFWGAIRKFFVCTSFSYVLLPKTPKPRGINVLSYSFYETRQPLKAVSVTRALQNRTHEDFNRASSRIFVRGVLSVCLVVA